MKKEKMETKNGNVIIAGGSGYIGTELSKVLLNQGYEVCILSRSAPKTKSVARFVKWDGMTLDTWVKELNEAIALINLAGRSIDCVKTPENSDEILRSRVVPTLLLGKAIRKVEAPPLVWIQMSTAHIHGDPLSTTCTEGSETGFGFAPIVGRAWEKAYKEAVLPEMRQVILRTSFVLGKNSGAIKRLAFLARIGLGGKIGHGKQGMSWIHEADMNRLFLRAIADETMRGIYIATAPDPVPNDVFMRQMRKAVGMPLGLPSPAWLVKIGAAVLRTDPELALYGRYCRSEKLKEEGFRFNYPNLKEALDEIFRK